MQRCMGRPAGGNRLLTGLRAGVTVVTGTTCQACHRTVPVKVKRNWRQGLVRKEQGLGLGGGDSTLY